MLWVCCPFQFFSLLRWDLATQRCRKSTFGQTFLWKKPWKHWFLVRKTTNSRKKWLLFKLQNKLFLVKIFIQKKKVDQTESFPLRRLLIPRARHRRLLGELAVPELGYAEARLTTNLSGRAAKAKAPWKWLDRGRGKKEKSLITKKSQKGNDWYCMLMINKGRKPQETRLNSYVKEEAEGWLPSRPFLDDFARAFLFGYHFWNDYPRVVNFNFHQVFWVLAGYAEFDPWPHYILHFLANLYITRMTQGKLLHLCQQKVVLPRVRVFVSWENPHQPPESLSQHARLGNASAQGGLPKIAQRADLSSQPFPPSLMIL